MPGKPHKTSFPEKAFTVKDGKSLNSEWKCLSTTAVLLPMMLAMSDETMMGQCKER